MTDLEKRPIEVKEKINEVVDSVLAFANRIIDDCGLYTISEFELATHLRMAVIFYRAREDSKVDPDKRAVEFGLPSIKECNDIMKKELEKTNA